MLCFGKTDIGKQRKENQDSFLICEFSSCLSAVVCDGMGGVNGGKIASEIAARTYSEALKNTLCVKEDRKLSDGAIYKILADCVNAANAAVYDRSLEDNMLTGMGTTLVAALIRDEAVYAINIGDSRCYKMKDGTLTQVSSDHSLVQFLLDNGEITKEEADNHPRKNIIMRALGINSVPEPDVFRIDEYDCILLCSDGLTNCVDDCAIEAILNDESAAEKKCSTLIEAALDGGGYDNITAVVIDTCKTRDLPHYR